jgi:hypothetical protein
MSNNFRLGFPLERPMVRTGASFGFFFFQFIYLGCGVVHRTRALSDGLASHFSAAYLGAHPSGMLLVSALTIDQPLTLGQLVANCGSLRPATGSFRPTDQRFWAVGSN